MKNVPDLLYNYTTSLPPSPGFTKDFLAANFANSHDFFQANPRKSVRSCTGQQQGEHYLKPQIH